MADYQEPYLTMKLSGVSYDVPAYELPNDVWSAGRNVRFTDGKTEKFEGHTQVFGSLGTEPRWMIPVGYSSVYYWVYASDTKIYATDMSVHYDITPTEGVPGVVNFDDNWNGGLINNFAVLNNSVGPPIWWNGSPSSVCTTLPGWPTGYLVNIIRPYKNFLIAMNIYDGITRFPDAVLWSAQAAAGYVPASWDIADPTNASGQYELSDSPGDIVDGMQLGDLFVIYKRRTCYTMQYIGGQYIHQFRQLFPGVGALATGCVASVPGKGHIVLTTDDIIIHDGSSYTSLLSKRLRSWLFRSISSTYLRRSFVVINKLKNEAWVCVPIDGNQFANLALIWNFETNAVGFRDLPNTRCICPGVIDTHSVSSPWDSDSDLWDSDASTWDDATFSPATYKLLMADHTNSKFFELDSGATFDGTPFVSYAIRESLAPIDRNNFKYLKAVYPRISSLSGGTVYLRAGTQENATDPIEWGEYMEFVLNEDDSVDCDLKGRYFSLEIKSDSAVDWQLHSIDIEIELAERF